jgi:hypothetical protein
VSRLDEFLPGYDVRERHKRRVPGPPELAVAAALGTPVAPDALVRTLFRLRGLPGGGSVHGALRAIGLKPLVEEPECDITATAAGEGMSILATETRVAAMDAEARRAFRRYWLAVGPFSALIRRRWLAAAERALR